MPQERLVSDASWMVREDGFGREEANFHETVFTVGNGYLGTRGALEEGHQGALSATYLSGIYDHHDSTVIDLVNAPDWTDLAVWAAGVRLDVDNCKVVEHRRGLDMQTGGLFRETVFEDADGRRTQLRTLRIAAMHDRHLCAIEIDVTPLNHAGAIVIESGLNGHRRNLDRLPAYPDGETFDPQVKWDKWAKSRHMRARDAQAGPDGLYLEMETIDTGHQIGYASRLVSSSTQGTSRFRREAERVSELLSIEADEGQTITASKFVAIYTSRDVNATELKSVCVGGLDRAGTDFDRLFEQSKEAWARLWSTCDVQILGQDEATRATRFNIYHLLICGNPDDPKVNIGAKSLSGEGYKGHVFWDTELFMLPFFIYAQPDTAKALLLYRYHTLDGARANAKSNGFQGAQYPWESADTGVETTPKWTADGQHRIWTGEEEIHVTSDVAHGLLTYVKATGDEAFLLEHGLEILIETCRFWASRLEYNEAEDRYELTRVIGPDEFHEHVDNNTFTNCLAQWQLLETCALMDQLKQTHAQAVADVTSRLALDPAEPGNWKALADKIYIPIDRTKDLIEQYEGYFDALDVPVTDWDKNNMPRYPEGYTHFNSGETQLVKQPDVVMLLYILPDAFGPETKAANFAYYEPRTLHKSSLSPAVHAIMGIEVGDTAKALLYFERAAYVDLANNQGNTQDGIHIASAGGTWQALVFGFGGFRVKEGKMNFAPWLPDTWEGLNFRLNWRGDLVTVRLRRSSIEFEAAPQSQPIDLCVFGQSHVLGTGDTLTVPF